MDPCSPRRWESTHRRPSTQLHGGARITSPPPSDAQRGTRLKLHTSDGPRRPGYERARPHPGLKLRREGGRRRELFGPDSWPGLGRRFALMGGELTIGRDGKNGIVVDLDTVSRRHAKIVIREGRSYVVDLKSTNGTYLNNKEVLEESPLRSGNSSSTSLLFRYVPLKVGGSIFKFLSGGDIERI